MQLDVSVKRRLVALFDDMPLPCLIQLIQRLRPVLALPGEYVVSGSDDPKLAATLTGWLADHDLALGDLRAGRQRLEDVFLRLTGDTRDDAR